MDTPSHVLSECFLLSCGAGLGVGQRNRGIQRVASLAQSLPQARQYPSLLSNLLPSPPPLPQPHTLTTAYLGLLTLGVVPSVKLKQLSRTVREGVHIDAVPQHNDNPVDITHNRGP